jgi:hypothetical protein
MGYDDTGTAIVYKTCRLSQEREDAPTIMTVFHPPPIFQTAVPHNFFPAFGQVRKIGKSEILQHDRAKKNRRRFFGKRFSDFFQPPDTSRKNQIEEFCN